MIGTQSIANLDVRIKAWVPILMEMKVHLDWMEDMTISRTVRWYIL